MNDALCAFAHRLKSASRPRLLSRILLSTRHQIRCCLTTLGTVQNVPSSMGRVDQMLYQTVFIVYACVFFACLCVCVCVCVCVRCLCASLIRACVNQEIAVRVTDG